MKTILIFSLIASLFPAGQHPASNEEPAVAIRGIESEYNGLDEVKATLVNESDVPVYLLAEDCGEAKMMRFNEILERWVSSLSTFFCQEGDPVEIKPGESYRLPTLKWRPMVNREGKAIESNRLPGRYKIEIQYSPEPYKREPLAMPRLKRVWKVTSSEFRIVQ